MKQWIVSAHLNGLDVVDQQFATYQKIYPQVRGLRNMGSLTWDLCFLADNIVDVIFNQGCYFWDLAAASVILNEAGGKIFDDQGHDLQFDWTDTKKKYTLIACSPENIEQVLSISTMSI